MTKMIAERAINRNEKRTIYHNTIGISPKTARKLERLEQITGIPEMDLIDAALNLIGDKTGETVEVSFTMTAKQYQAVKAVCDDYRLGVGELAKDGLFTILEGHADSAGGHDWILESLRMANAEQATGKHPRFESWQATLAKGAEQVA